MNREEFLEKYIGKTVQLDLLGNDWKYNKSTSECYWNEVQCFDFEEIRISLTMQLDDNSKIVDVSEISGERLVNEDATHCEYEAFDANDYFEFCDESLEDAIDAE